MIQPPFSYNQGTTASRNISDHKNHGQKIPGKRWSDGLTCLSNPRSRNSSTQFYCISTTVLRLHWWLKTLVNGFAKRGQSFAGPVYTGLSAALDFWLLSSLGVGRGPRLPSPEHLTPPGSKTTCYCMVTPHPTP